MTTKVNVKRAIDVAASMNDMSSTDLASKAGLMLNKLNRFRSGRQQPKVDELSSIAAAVDMKVSELIALGE